MKRYLLGSSLVVVAALGGAFGFFAMRKPAMAAPSSVKVEMSSERIARGKYLFQVVSGCDDCHTDRDWTKFSAPPNVLTRGRGVTFPADMGLPGKVSSKNITPDPVTGLGAWTDGEKIRAIREGVSRDGYALFPMMPYNVYRHMSDDDVNALVAYLNSLPPITHAVPPTQLDFPVNLLIKSAPQPVAGSVVTPDRADPVKYGEYMVHIAGCIECHTPSEKGEPVKGMTFAGGQEFHLGKFLVHTANITPDAETGIGEWTEARFIQKFRGYAQFAETGAPKAVQANFTMMPWTAFSKLTDEDLKAIFAYLRTVKPVYNRVDKHPELPQS